MPATMIAVGLGGRVDRTFRPPLAELTPGDYRVVIDVIDDASGRTLTAIETFSIEGPARRGS